MLVFRQSNNVTTIKRMFFFYSCHISMFVFFHILVLSSSLTCLHKSTALRVGVKALHNPIFEENAERSCDVLA